MERNLLMEHLGPNGKMISGSKSGYRDRNPKNLAIFNSNVCVVEKGVASKIWYGDIDITISRNDLKKLASTLGTDIYVLFEMDARFEYENNPRIASYAYKVSPDGSESLGERLSSYYSIETLEKLD